MSILDLLAASGLACCLAVALAAVAFVAWAIWPPKRHRRKPGTPPDYAAGRNRLAAELRSTTDTRRWITEVRQLNDMWPDHPTWPRKEDRT